MKILDMIKTGYVIEELQAKTKRDVLTELSSVFLRDLSCDPEEMVSILLEREKLGSTGIGDGIAIPHGKMGSMKELVVAFGRSRKGIDFNAMDGKSVHLFFLLMAPENSAGLHLKALARISRMLKDGAFRKRLLDARSEQELRAAIAEKDEAP
ncbi:MAG TPA: PTS sugar transporter subunit IIA [Syntrophales bacterium]|nr:PTS sugar transporter subunit IIA [Syntrophales bacterium]